MAAIMVEYGLYAIEIFYFHTPHLGDCRLDRKTIGTKHKPIYCEPANDGDVLTWGIDNMEKKATI